MRYSMFEKTKDELILVSRILLMILFIVFGWEKMTGFSGTVEHLAAIGTPAPTLAAIVAVVFEVPLAIAILVGFYTRPVAFLYAFYTIATALIGHQFWKLTGIAAVGSEINFFKNVSIMGGLFLLCVTGPGKYSFDKK
ncbi:DoxX family protein [Paraburkholderia xenovorans]|uniref:DoxX family protein n=1 Tax=Paraburkholderia xenovorans TaxID=36873 RepID=UPI0038B7A49C